LSTARRLESSVVEADSSEELGYVPDVPAIRIPAAALSFSGFRAWATSDDFPERLRASYIDREIHLDKSPEELETHNQVKTEVTIVLGTLVKSLDLGRFYSDRTLISNNAAELSTEPDASFVSWQSFKARRVRLTERKGVPGEYTELVGTPDWVLEVVSRSSVLKNTKILREAYHRAGIPEYWLVDARHDEVSFQMLRRQRDHYAAVRVRDGWRRSRVFGRGFALTRKTNRLGNWQYTLSVAT
jgi:Uma2 family endonuclease